MDWINLTDHAAVRWKQRTDNPGVGPIVAWNEAIRAEPADVVADEVRYHESTDTLLVRRQTRLVTVLPADTYQTQRPIGGANPA
jgi:hypothetical protein